MGFTYMNIFVLSKSPVYSAQMQCNKHIVKMVLESAQMLSTAHRMLDGVLHVNDKGKGKYIMEDQSKEDLLYKVTHPNHPCSIWTRESIVNYMWHYQHFVALCDEYTYRYNKKHATDAKLRDLLFEVPHNINRTKGLTPWAQAMPENFRNESVTQAYRSYYRGKKVDFDMKWTRRPQPEWFNG